MGTTGVSPRFDDARDHWNARFAGEGLYYGAEPNAWLVEHAGLLPAGGRVLSVADGEGRHSIWLARRGFDVEAFDIAEAGVAKARALARQAGVQVRFDVAGVDDHAWPVAAVDGVVAIFVQFADPALRGRMFARIVQALKPGGVLVLLGYGLRQLEFGTGGPGRADHLYTTAQLREDFASLQIVELREFEADLAEGRGHCGRSALVGLVARKP